MLSARPISPSLLVRWLRRPVYCFVLDLAPPKRNKYAIDIEYGVPIGLAGWGTADRGQCPEGLGVTAQGPPTLGEGRVRTRVRPCRGILYVDLAGFQLLTDMSNNPSLLAIRGLSGLSLALFEPDS